MAKKIDVEFSSNLEVILMVFEEAGVKALTRIGNKIERYAKKLCPVGKSIPMKPSKDGKKKRRKWAYRGGTLRQSITYKVKSTLDEKEVTVGSNVEYAPYVELGTGKYFEAPPEWEEFNTPPAKGTGKSFVKPRPYLRPAIEDHKDEFRKIIEDELKKMDKVVKPL